MFVVWFLLVSWLAQRPSVVGRLLLAAWLVAVGCGWLVGWLVRSFCRAGFTLECYFVADAGAGDQSDCTVRIISRKVSLLLGWFMFLLGVWCGLW